jgi:WD40 repeat protein
MTRSLAALLLGLLMPTLAVLSDAPAAKTDAYGDPLPAGVSMRIGTVRWRHEGTPHNVQFSADGKTILSCDTISPRAWLWDTASGRPLRTFPAGAPWGYHVAALSPEGKTVATLYDGSVHLWDAATGEELKKFTVDPMEWLDVIFAPNGKTLAGRARECICLWNLATGKVVLTVPATASGMGTVVYSPDGSLLAFSPRRGVIQVWNTETLQECGVLRAGAEALQESVSSLAFTRDGRTLLAGGDRRANPEAEPVAILRVWELASGKVRLEINDPSKVPARIVSVALSPDDLTVAAFDLGPGQITLWDVRTGQRLRELATALPPVNSYGRRCLAFSPDGKTLATTAGGNVLNLWDVATGKQLHAYSDAPEGGFRKIASTKDGDRLATFGTDRAIRIWDARTGKQLKLFDPYETTGYGLAIAPNAKRLVSSTNDGWVRVYDFNTYRELWKERIANCQATGVAFSPDGRLVASAHLDPQRQSQPAEADEADSIQLWDAETGKQIRRIPTNLSGQGAWLLFSQDSTTLYAHGWATGTHTQFDVDSGKKLRQFEPPGKSEVAYSHLLPQHNLMVIARNDGTVAFMEMEKGREIRTLEISPGYPCAVALSKDAKFLATGPYDLFGNWQTSDRKLIVREFSTNKVVRTFDVPDDLRISSLQFSADGKHIVTGTLNCTILFWDWTKPADKSKESP